jgi:hypothetical protein
MRLDQDDEDADDLWYEPTPSRQVEYQPPTARDIGIAAVKAILDRLGPAPVEPGGGGAYREHLLNPPPGPGDTACACVACQRLAEFCKTMPIDQAVARTLEGLRR